MPDVDMDHVLQQAKLLGIVPHPLGDNLSDELVYKYMLMSIPVEESDKVEIAALAFENSRFKIYINLPNIYEAFKDVCHDENEWVALVRGLLKHELLHFLFKHYLPNKGNRMLENIAMDAVINDKITEFKHLNLNFVKAEEVFEAPEKFHGICGTTHFKDATWEMVYMKLEELFKDRAKTIVIAISGGMGSGSFGNQDSDSDSGGSGKQGDGNGSGSGEQKVNEELEDKLSGAVLKPGDDLERITEDAIEEADIFTGQIAKAAEAEADKLKGSGLGMTLLKMTYKYSKPVLNWKNVIVGTLGEFYRDVSFKRLSKRFDMPPGSKVFYNAKVLTLVDVSGSIVHYIDNFLSQLLNIVKDYDLDVGFYDDELRTLVNKNAIIRKDYEVNGGGGTSLKNTLEDERLHKLRKYDVVIVFTDGYDDVPDRKLFRGKKVVFVFSEDYSENFADEVRKFAKVGIMKEPEN